MADIVRNMNPQETLRAFIEWAGVDKGEGIKSIHTEKFGNVDVAVNYVMGHQVALVAFGGKVIHLHPERGIMHTATKPTRDVNLSDVLAAMRVAERK